MIKIANQADGHSKEDRIISFIRRKPRITYKSPTADDHVYFNMPSSQPSSRPPSRKSSPSSRTQKPGARDARYNKCVIYPTLPLFHPLGDLAMSLPPLDPNEYGLPLLSTPDERDPGPQSRFKRPATQPPKAEEDSNGAASAMSNNAATVAAREVKERASPRKRRAGGAKRKRKDADDGDATYPAKRTRIPRGGGGRGAEDDSPVDSMEMSESVGAIPEGLSDPTDNTVRRSARAKGSSNRRDSGGSETTSITANGETPNADTMGGTGSHRDQSQGGEEKEEGELSDGAKT